MNKLLNKPLKIFAIYALLILVCSIPVYYFIVDSIWIEELDEHNQIVKKQTQGGFNSLVSNKEDLAKSIDLFTRIQPGIIIYPAENFGIDSVYTRDKTASYGGGVEMDRFRGLISYIKISEKPYRIIVETNVEEADETVLAISIITCIFIALLILGFIFLNKRLSKKVWQPFINSLEKLRGFDLNNASSIDFATTDIVEFKELNSVLSKLIDSNILVYSQQKEFLQNASHELQTPLALLKSKIDLLIQDKALTQQQRETIGALSASVSRVSKINKNLLLLAGIENKTYPSTYILLNKVSIRILNDFKEYLSGERIVIENLSGRTSLETNESLLEILITNLLSNAFRHSQENAKVSVELVNRKLTIKNTGDSSLKSEALFKRFQSASPDNPGTGLGLAIAKEICHKYGWKISYQFANNEHQFSVIF